ncbi:hypothetical protein [Aeromicrobium flavum]|uniref:hypothetical protein n=1 Tax=Aeromicrobium flavum TaxID=416568 RepID=UPI0011BD4E4D|nr:hypothetical protein [Aeromicrobium flavum]
MGTVIGFKIRRAERDVVMFDDLIFLPVIICSVVAVASIAGTLVTVFVDDDRATSSGNRVLAKLHAVPMGIYGACTLMIADGDAASVVSGITFAIGTTIHLSWLRLGLGLRRPSAPKRRSAWRLVAESALMVGAFVVVSSWLAETQEPDPVASPVVIHTRVSAQADLDAAPGIPPVLPAEIPRDYQWEGFDRHERDGSGDVVVRSSTFVPWSDRAQLPTVRVCAREPGQASCVRGLRPVERTAGGLDVMIAFVGSHQPSDEDVEFWTTVPLAVSLDVSWLFEE